MTAQGFIAAAATLVVAGVSPIVILPLLRRAGAIDHPVPRSSHTSPALRGLGVSTALALLIGALIAFLSAAVTGSALLLAAVLTAVASAALGLTEDIRGIRITTRIVVQLAVGAVGSIVIVTMTQGPWWVSVVGALAVVASINVCNFMDGVDGLSGMNAAVFGAAYTVLGWIIGSDWLVLAGAMVAIAYLAFLPWNLASRGFLGDSGSYLLGGVVAAMGIGAVSLGAPILAVVAPMAIYLADTGFTLVRRVLRGEKWHQSHRQHTYHQLEDLGFSHVRAALVVTGGTLATSLIGILSLAVVDPWFIAFPAILFVCAGYLSLPTLIGRRRNRAVE